MKHEAFTKEVPGARVCVLMVHGIFGSPHHFDMLLPHIPADWSLRSIQLDGHGNSLHNFIRTDRQKWETQLQAEIKSVCERYDRVLVVAHSMGCMLSANAIVQLGFESKIAGMLFLGAALYPKCDPSFVGAGLRLIYRAPEHDTPITAAARYCCGVSLHKRFWEYVACVPPLIGLFSMARYTRRRIENYDLPMYALQFWRDEVVMRRSIRPFFANPHADGEFLKHSMHFYYPPEDLERMCAVFDQIVTEVCENAQNVSLAD